MTSRDSTYSSDAWAPATVPPRLQPPPGPPPAPRSPRELLGVLALVANGRLRLRRCDVIGPRARLRGRPHVVNRGHIEIGDRVTLHSHLVPIELQTVNGGRIEIGHGTFVNYGTIVTAYDSVRIGCECLIGHHVTILDNSEHDVVHRGRPGRSRPVDIGDRVWLCDRAIVLPGVRIGEGAVVGAGAVVTKDVPAWTLAAGNPARVIRRLR
jgi:acetyltransferase-like isoleucine patch superfamily enzyme